VIRVLDDTPWPQGTLEFEAVPNDAHVNCKKRKCVVCDTLGYRVTTTTFPEETAPDDAVTQLGDIARNMPQRRKLTDRERVHRRARRAQAKRSRRRNR
jgi:hypothetical protein